jgi:hypothetical protein
MEREEKIEPEIEKRNKRGGEGKGKSKDRFSHSLMGKIITTLLCRTERGLPENPAHQGNQPGRGRNCDQESPGSPSELPVPGHQRRGRLLRGPLQEPKPEPAHRAATNRCGGETADGCHTQPEFNRAEREPSP